MFFSFPKAKSCSNGKVFTECASTCPLTCMNKNQDPSSECSSNCQAGCICPYGMYTDLAQNGTCVKESDCSCFYHGSFYSKNQFVNVDCNQW